VLDPAIQHRLLILSCRDRYLSRAPSRPSWIDPEMDPRLAGTARGMTTRAARRATLAGPTGMCAPSFQQKRNFLVKVQISAELCQGHGRCYDIAPALFDDDEEGYGQVPGDGAVPPELQDAARRAALNCPEHAIKLIEAT
jgi:ferredoxin